MNPRAMLHLLRVQARADGALMFVTEPVAGVVLTLQGEQSVMRARLLPEHYLGGLSATLRAQVLNYELARAPRIEVTLVLAEDPSGRLLAIDFPPLNGG